MATAERSMDFDFFINLSDADVALRTHAELAAFLSRFRARSFVAVKFPDVDELRYHAHAHMRKQVWLEYAAPGASGRPHGGRRRQDDRGGQGGLRDDLGSLLTNTFTCELSSRRWREG